MRPKKVMRLRSRAGQEEIKEIGGIELEEAWGYRVRGINGEDLGYFGADKYESILFEIQWLASSATR